MKCRKCGKECVDVGFGHCEECARGSSIEILREHEKGEVGHDK